MRNIIILKFSLSLLLLGTLGCAHMNIDSGNSESSILWEEEAKVPIIYEWESSAWLKKEHGYYGV